jgi:hypothetical protein
LGISDGASVLGAADCRGAASSEIKTALFRGDCASSGVQPRRKAAILSASELRCGGAWALAGDAKVAATRKQTTIESQRQFMIASLLSVGTWPGGGRVVRFGACRQRLVSATVGRVSALPVE